VFILIYVTDGNAIRFIDVIRRAGAVNRLIFFKGFCEIAYTHISEDCGLFYDSLHRRVPVRQSSRSNVEVRGPGEIAADSDGCFFI
jgi:hypothetical protein